MILFRKTTDKIISLKTRKVRERPGSTTRPIIGGGAGDGAQKILPGQATLSQHYFLLNENERNEIQQSLNIDQV